MSFMQVFGATVAVMICYVLAILVLSTIFMTIQDGEEDAFIFSALIISMIMFAAMFIIWYRGVPVPEWLK